MSDYRARMSVLAAGAVSLAMVAGPLAVAAQDDGMMAMVSEECQAANLDDVLKNPGQLTLSTDNPSFPPWWGGDPSVDPDSGWEFSYPPSGEGLEGGVAYAIAHALGFEDEQVDWIQNTVFEVAFAPGPKPFDFHMAQISIRPERAENIDFTDPYFDNNQSLIANADTDIASATSMEELKGYQLGAAVGTTALQFIEEQIQPDIEPQVFNDNSGAIQALENGQIDGIIVDVGSALFAIAVQLSNGTIVGQFSNVAQEEQMGIVLEQGSPLTACINEAIAAIRESGELQAIYDATITEAASVPFIE